MSDILTYDDVKPGAIFEPDDFADPYFMPGGKYESLEIVAVGDDDVQILYHGRNEYDDKVTVIDKEQIYQMLGIEPIGDNPLGDEEYLGTVEGTKIYAKRNLSHSKAAIYNKAINTHESLISNGTERLSGLRIEFKNGFMTEIHCEE